MASSKDFLSERRGRGLGLGCITLRMPSAPTEKTEQLPPNTPRGVTRLDESHPMHYSDASEKGKCSVLVPGLEVRLVGFNFGIYK
jgi:hypothetical protein